MIDTDAAFRAILAGATGVTNLVSTRIYAGYLPEGVTENVRVSKPSITFAVDANSPGANAYAPTTDVDYLVRCWATSSVGARAIYAAVKDALDAIDNQVFASVHVYDAIEQKPGRNDETELGDKFCEAVFRVGMRTA